MACFLTMPISNITPISAMMLKEFFVHYVILGHSERRSIYGETNEVINAKVRKARELNMKPIFCIGETLEERETGRLEKVLRTQVSSGLQGLSERDLLDTVIAYEPVWAIGTGVTATAAQAQEAHAFVRSLVAEQFGADSAAKRSARYRASRFEDGRGRSRSARPARRKGQRLSGGVTHVPDADDVGIRRHTAGVRCGLPLRGSTETGPAPFASRLGGR